MTGLFIKELLIRGDLCRCLIVCPGNLVEQWQDELERKFSLPFEILTNDRIEAARTGNVFNELPLCIARLDKLARDEDLQFKLQQSDWDLIVVDEAHKMSASFFGGEVKYTKRYRLGQLLRGLHATSSCLRLRPIMVKKRISSYLWLSLMGTGLKAGSGMGSIRWTRLTSCAA
ncbi:RNA polymerase-associated protein RapA [Moorella thermoacetica]